VSPLSHAVTVFVVFSASLQVMRWSCREFFEAIDQGGFRQANRRALACQRKNASDDIKVLFRVTGINVGSL
jgi:hypothetical protein